MGFNKELKVYNRWIFLFFLVILVGVLSAVIDIVWIKKTLWVILVLIGFVASGSMYQMYEIGLNKLEKKTTDKKE